MPVLLFKKESMDLDKPFPVVNIPPARFIGGTKKLGRKGILQGSWDPEILVAAITVVGVPVDEDLADIGMNPRMAVIYMECDGKEYWVSSLVSNVPRPQLSINTQLRAVVH